MQGGEERAGLDDERPSGDLLDAARHAQAVESTGGERFQNQEIEGTLQQRRATAGHRFAPGIDIR
jgi:hypothetical protein